MPKINLLPKNVSELIAAGEVVERPASVIKELIENSIDAGGSEITVEIQQGGIKYIRITDNGCGIQKEDVPKAFLRHATSKIATDTDLNSIRTLGFRGEALAAISSVSRVEMLTKTEDSDVGTHCVLEGGEEVLSEDSGCPSGTTIIIRDIFYNTPARMKFLKKDVSEANACISVAERIALSHPEISFKVIRDGKTAFFTSGDGNIKSCIYSVLGREFTNTLIEVSSHTNGISVNGFTCKPVFCRPTRNNQYIFLNGRLVKSGTVVAAAEQAYKNSAMVGKFPGFVLYVKLPFDTVDINVHPAKTEVRFSDEKRVFEAVYSAVKNTIVSSDTRPQITLNANKTGAFSHISAAEYRQQRIDDNKTIAEIIYDSKPKENRAQLTFQSPRQGFSGAVLNANTPKKTDKKDFDFLDVAVNEKSEEKPKTQESFHIKTSVNEPEITVPKETEKSEELPEIFLIGEAFSTYIVVQMGNSIFMIDKHAAHERILFNKLIKEHKTEVQALLSPMAVSLAPEEYDALINNTKLLSESGFEIEDFGNSTVMVRAIPVFLTGEDISGILSEVAEGLISGGSVSTDREEHLFHTIACRAAIKAGNDISRAEMLDLAKKVLLSDDIRYCPHGRPVAFEIKKRDLEKQFGRIQ